MTALAAAGAVIAGLRRAGVVRTGAIALGVAVAAQYTLGVLTLLFVVPVGLAALHQATAVLVLTAALVLLHASFRGSS